MREHLRSLLAECLRLELDCVADLKLMCCARAWLPLAVVALVAAAAAEPPLAQTLAIPSYWPPSATVGSTWERALEAAPPVDLVVINPDSGPGPARDAAYAAQVVRAHAASPTLSVLGYVHTSYGKRDAAAVRGEIVRYFQWYAVDGIFIDEVPTSVADLPYYTALAAFVRAQAAPAAGRGAGKVRRALVPVAAAAPLVVLNPGTDLDQAYEPLFDVVMSFEDTLAAYLRFEPSPWMRNALAPERVWHCVHTAGGPPGNASGPLAQAVQRSKTLNAGVLFMTNETTPNPYEGLPSEFFWEDLIRWATNHFQ